MLLENNATGSEETARPGKRAPNEKGEEPLKPRRVYWVRLRRFDHIRKATATFLKFGGKEVDSRRGLVPTPQRWQNERMIRPCEGAYLTE